MISKTFVTAVNIILSMYVPTSFHYTGRTVQQAIAMKQDVERNIPPEVRDTLHRETSVIIPMQVEATAYEGDTITSTGVRPRVNHTIAVDPKVIPYGTRVYIPEFNKIFVAEDCGGAIKGKKIDIFMANKQQCFQWGRQNITIYILKD